MNSSDTFEDPPPPPPTGPLPDPPNVNTVISEPPVIMSAKKPSPPTTPSTKSTPFHYHPSFGKKALGSATHSKSSSLSALHEPPLTSEEAGSNQSSPTQSTSNRSSPSLESKKTAVHESSPLSAASPNLGRLGSRMGPSSSPGLSRSATVSHTLTPRTNNIQLLHSLQQGQVLTRDMTIKKVVASPQAGKTPTGLPSRSLSVKHLATLDKAGLVPSNTPPSSMPTKQSPALLHKRLDYSAASMHWYKVNDWGRRAKTQPKPLRAHTMTLVHDKLFVLGGCDSKGQCQSDIMILDPDTMQWSTAKTRGTLPPPCRAHSSVLLDHKLYVYGGGDAEKYFDALYTLDTQTFLWEKLETEPNSPCPGPRRAHTSWAYQGHIYIYAGGDGAKALGDVYQLQVLSNTTKEESVPNEPSMKLSHSSGTLNLKKPSSHVPSSAPFVTRVRWHLMTTTGASPTARGYHTSNTVGSKVVVFGGSDGHECFSDVYLLDMKDMHWTHITLNESIPRLSHTSTLVGSYLFIIGGHDGSKYTQSVLLLNLVTMRIERRRVTSQSALGGPKGRGYHVACLYDSRIFVYGGYDGEKVFDDVWVLELSACGYLPQITAFELLK